MKKITLICIIILANINAFGSFKGYLLGIKSDNTIIIETYENDTDKTSLKKVTVEELEVELKKLFFKSKSHTRFLLYTHSNSNYQTYISVQNAIQKILMQIREKESQKIFGVNYDALDENKQKIMRQCYPMRIKENYGDYFL